MDLIESNEIHVHKSAKQKEKKSRSRKFYNLPLQSKMYLCILDF